MSTEPHTPANPAWFRQVLGQYPTGVCVITAMDAEGQPAGMVVGSFTSVSLTPPLVAFLPDRNSSTWARLRSADHFCVNILGADQEALCRRFSSKELSARAKFDGVSSRKSPLGAPVIDDVVAWIDCQRHTLHEAGDHDIVIGEVQHLKIEAGGLPLLFFQGGYGRFLPQSLATGDPLGALTVQLRDVDAARPFMESLSDELSVRCMATVQVEGEIVVAAGAGRPRRGSVPTLVGQRFPFIPPTGSVFAAWMEDAARRRWLSANAPPARAQDFEDGLVRVRARGFSLGLLSEAQREFAQVVHRLATERTPAVSAGDMRELIQSLSFEPATLDDTVARSVRLISVPVLVGEGTVAMALTLLDFPKPSDLGALLTLVERLRRAADDITTRLRPPPLRRS